MYVWRGGEGEYYYNARWYDPTLGRFITEDPARSGVDWYAYVNNNPLAYVDPTGLRTGDTKEGITVVNGKTIDFAENAALRAPAGKDPQQAIQTRAKTTNEYGSSDAKQAAAVDEIKHDLIYWVAKQKADGHTPSVAEMMAYGIQDLQDRKQAAGWLLMAQGVEIIAGRSCSEDH